LHGRRRTSSHRKRKKSLAKVRLMAAVAVMAGVTGLLTTTESPIASAGPPASIMVSASPDRSDSDHLARSSQSGRVYIFVTAPAPVDSVRFVVDPRTDHEWTLTDDSAPYDLAGTAPDGTAKPYDVSPFSAGSHKVVAWFKEASGRTVARSSAVFSVVAPSEPQAASTTTGSTTTGSTTTGSTTTGSTTTGTTTPTDEVVINAAPDGIAAALTKVRDANRQGKAVRLVLRAATYRESLLLEPWASATSAPITIDGQGATISGANVLSSWTAVGDGTFRHHWPYNLGNQADPWPYLSYDRALLNREVLFVGQVPYHVVDSKANLDAGTFLVDEGADTITVRPREEHARFSSAEVTVRMKTLQVHGHSNVTIRNMTLERGAGGVQESMARSWHSPNFTFENITVRQAAATGMAIGGAHGATLRSVRFLDNGISGFGTSKQTGIVIENAELARTNWRGAQVGFTGWDTGVKFGITSNVTINGWNSHHNYSHGLWFDYDNRNITVDGLVSAGNLGRGLFLEKNPGPITVDNAKICNNGMSGISYARTDRATIKNSEVFNNSGWQHLHTGDANPVTMTDGTVVQGNMMTLQNTTTTVGDDWAQKDSMNKGWLFWQTRDEAAFWNSASFSGNTWYHTQRSDPFRVTAVWSEWYNYDAFANKVRETSGHWANPGTLTCPAPRPRQRADYAVGW
jgi:hypothetical protein